MHRDTNIGCSHIESRRGEWKDRGKENGVEEGGTHPRIMCRKQNERSSNKVGPQRAGGTKSKSQTVGSEGIRMADGGEGTRL